MKSALSLVELAVVILIIGILAVTVSAGSTLVEQSKMQRIMNDAKEYTDALNLFESQYDELPGDMTSASALAWFNVTNKSLQSNEYEGNGYITGYVEGSMSFWHMQLADLLDGSYTGFSSSDDEVPGIHVGYSRHSSESGFNFFTFGHHRNQWGYGTASVYDRTNVLALGFGNTYNSSSNKVCAAALTPNFTHKLDNKFDDGIPNRGNILADHGTDVGNSSQCTNFSGYASGYSVTDGILSYNDGNSDLKCRIMFIVRNN